MSARAIMGILGVEVTGRSTIAFIGVPVEVAFRARVSGPPNVLLADVDLVSVHIVEGGKFTPVNIGSIIQSDRLFLEAAAIGVYRALRDRIAEDDAQEERDRGLDLDAEEERLREIADRDERRAANDDGCGHA